MKQRDTVIVRDVHADAGASAWNDGLDFQKTFGHDEVNCAGID